MPTDSRQKSLIVLRFWQNLCGRGKCCVDRTCASVSMTPPIRNFSCAWPCVPFVGIFTQCMYGYALCPLLIFLQTEQALFYDAVMLLAKALKKPSLANLSPVPVSCDHDQKWPQGQELVRALGTTEIDGLTGKIRFNENRTRTDFKMDIVQLLSGGYQDVSNGFS